MKNIFLIILSIFIFVFAKNIKCQNIINGTIKDAYTNNILYGANIIVMETSEGSISDENGNFKIELPSLENTTIIISYIGYEKKILAIPKENVNKKDFIIYLIPSILTFDETIITATKTERKKEDIPARVNSIGKQKIQESVSNNIDDLLRTDANISVDRRNGIFSKNSSVTMRGLGGSYRTLILVDGVPINKTDGGGINWNRIFTEDVDHIEVIKGPASALYGGSSMSGTINIITKKPNKPYGLTAKTFFGSYNSCGAYLSIYGNDIKNNKGFYWNTSGFYRRGDGYIAVPDSLRDSTNAALYLKEGSVNFQIGYQYNLNNQIEIEYSYYDDKRGDGVHIYDPDGSFNKYTTNYIRGKYNFGNNKTKGIVNVFYQRENYYNQKESIKYETFPPYSVTSYTLYHVESKREDMGLWASINRQFFTHHSVTAGLDFKLGRVDASDVYHTSTDTVTNIGNMFFGAIFAQDEMSFFNNNLIINAGLRLDYANFFDASYYIKSPTAVTALLFEHQGDFDNAAWYSLNPKIGLLYKFNKSLSIYASYSKGFRPPILDDMCRNGNISKGFKFANPYLKPENIHNVELGITYKIKDFVLIEPTIYYSLGTDFQYFVGTGDTITSGNKPKPIITRENVGEAEVLGAEINIKASFLKWFILHASYAYNYSKIKNYRITDYVAKDLTGKFLMEVPPHQASVSLAFNHRYINASISAQYIGKVWTDDENTSQISDVFLMNAKIYRTFFNKLSVSISVQNLLNRQYLDNKNMLGIGRYIMGELTFKL